MQGRGVSKWVRACVLASALLAVLPHAQAGRGCEAKALSVSSITQSMTLAEHTVHALDASGAKVVALARVGQDLSKWHQHYSHMAWAYRDDAGWRVVHKLNECGTSHADVFRQGLAEFFLDDLFEYEAAFVVPSAEVQAKLLPLLKDNQRLTRLHERAYSMLAYPWSQRYQQSNQWAAETLALAMEPAATSRDKAQAWLKFKGYEPTQLEISALTRLGARVTKANVAFDDHPNALRFAGHIQTTTVDSVLSWLQRAGLAGAPQVVR